MFDRVPVDDDRVKALTAAATALGVTPAVLLGTLAGQFLAHEPRELQVLACFERGWRGHRDAGGRTGNKGLALNAWRLLLKRTGWEPLDALSRWGRYVKLTGGKFLKDVNVSIAHASQNLTDDALAALALREKAERGSSRGEQGAFAEDAYEERVAAARRGSAPIPQTRLPSAGPMFPEPEPEVES